VEFHWTQVAIKALSDLYRATKRPDAAAPWTAKLLN
jgi:hypothetical protein